MKLQAHGQASRILRLDPADADFTAAKLDNGRDFRRWLKRLRKRRRTREDYGEKDKQQHGCLVKVI
jgi:hypothetical protein